MDLSPTRPCGFFAEILAMAPSTLLFLQLQLLSPLWWLAANKRRTRMNGSKIRKIIPNRQTHVRRCTEPGPTPTRVLLDTSWRLPTAAMSQPLSARHKFLRSRRSWLDLLVAFGHMFTKEQVEMVSSANLDLGPRRRPLESNQLQPPAAAVNIAVTECRVIPN
ncbi:hypothetical protein CGRA01v4_00318 [Colletotrichum graminicola]|nr:hypothetical protein CGRA01v4_00318 [Colletotrichum graminicola]